MTPGGARPENTRARAVYERFGYQVETLRYVKPIELPPENSGWRSTSTWSNGASG